jgi:CRP/FNR family transcriptional regulator, cyclic AMP receptor protein
VSIEPPEAPDSLAADRAEQLVTLQSSGFLGGLSPQLADYLVRSAPLVRYRAGSMRTAERDAPWAAIVGAGVVRVYLPTPGGRQVTIRYARAGDLVRSSPAGARLGTIEIEAVEAADLLLLDVARLERTARLEPELSIALVGELDSRLRHAYRTLAGNTFATVRSRVARDLLERFGTGAPLPGVQVRVTQQALADATGSVREVVTRALRELRAQGLIRTDQSWITILDLDGLIREAGQTT